jgi:ATP-dependent exoDNAse (exonuclease V) beta subunit
MSEKLREQVLSAFKLTDRQKEAAIERGRDVVVTAGAGSGKTSTLVARYASLLADGFDLRKVLAITFSEKAAREMRSRVRKTISALIASASNDNDRKFWVSLNAKMDSARISTIHSLCAEILRAHPAEAVVDPKFEVVDEGLTAALRVQVVQDTLSKLVGIPEYKILFQFFEINEITDLFKFLLEKRLETREAFDSETDMQKIICEQLSLLLRASEFVNPISELRSMSMAEMVEDAGEAIAGQVEELLELWRSAEKKLASGDYIASTTVLYNVRRDKLKLVGGKRGSSTKEILKEIQKAYDELLNPICGGKNKTDEPPTAEGEAQFVQALALLKPAFEILESGYREGLTQLGGLDFDDLENGAAQLLLKPAIREIWQGQIDAVLVDEFQDTNQRQRTIVEALAGSSGHLFVVGDAKQSIYRFRRADVTVFRAMRQSIKSKGGLPVDLDETFRAHEPLLNGMNALLKEVMGDKEDPARLYYEPFAPLIAHHETPRDGIHGPHLEVVLGSGEDAETGRLSAAKSLARRLLELKEQQQIKSWDDVALLFRASTGFPSYESALEEANIPFITVAGQGFFDRAEIRDLLNLLRALADPSDDLAMVGLLRSPAFGLTDAALYQLRWKDKVSHHYWISLHEDLACLSDEDQIRAQRVLAIMEQMIPFVDRVPVAELLKKLIDATDYRAILAIEESAGGGGRLWRNLDKLVKDAQDSGKVNVRDFLDYLKVVNDAGAREGEAPAEVQGAVRLMTIHKSKGLQFPILVLADASRVSGNKGESAYLPQELGLSFKLDPQPMLYRLAKVLEKRQGEAEDHRVLYVALTRAQEKIIIIGHVKSTEKKGWSASGWLQELCDAAQVDVNAVVDQAGQALIVPIQSGAEVRAWAMPSEGDSLKAPDGEQRKPPVEYAALPIFAPLVIEHPLEESSEDNVQRHDWRVTGRLGIIPPNVIGTMVHKAIELWLFPGDPRLVSLLQTTALDAGLAEEVHREAAVQEAIELLVRFYDHPIRKEIEASAARYHELPYTRMVNDHAETGYIDLLYQNAEGLQILDFKTDSIRNEEHLEQIVGQYTRQMNRYSEVADSMLGQKAQARLCFLDVEGKLELVSI